MRSKRCRALAWVAVMAGCVFMLASPAMAAQKTVAGTLQAGYQLVTADGDLYDITQNDMGKKLMAFIGKKVEVKGAVSEDDVMKVITVIEYRLLTN